MGVGRLAVHFLAMQYSIPVAARQDVDSPRDGLRVYAACKVMLCAMIKRISPDALKKKAIGPKSMCVQGEGGGYEGSSRHIGSFHNYLAKYKYRFRRRHLHSTLCRRLQRMK
jgi:hypothetical protein